MFTLKTSAFGVAFTIAVFTLFGSRPDRVVASSAATTQTAQPSAAPFALKPLGHSVYAAIDDAKGDAGANAGFVIGDDGVMIIDTFEHPEAAKQMLAEIRKLTQLPIKFVVNTHYHIDHVAGNSLFQQNGAVVFAQRNVRSWIHTKNLKFFGKDIKAEDRTMVEALGAPDAVYDSGVYVIFWDRDALMFPAFFRGTLGGDSVVFIPDANVVFTGDLFWRNTLPDLINATTSAWIPYTQLGHRRLRRAQLMCQDMAMSGMRMMFRNFRDYLAFLLRAGCASCAGPEQRLAMVGQRGSDRLY